MKISLINASPRGRDAVSFHLLERLQAYMGAGTFTYAELCGIRDMKEACFTANETDVMVIASPVHFGTFPSALLGFMSEMAWRFNGHDIPVGFIINGGSYDPHQSDTAVHIASDWCAKLGMTFIMALCLGGGITLAKHSDNRNDDRIWKNPNGALAIMALGLLSSQKKENQYLLPAVPSFVYRQQAEAYFRKKIRESGLSAFDIKARPAYDRKKD